jgi:two-component system response regulator NreC
MDKIKLLLVDDHAVIRSGLRMLLEAQDDMVIVGEADSGRMAIEKVRELRPDIVLMDIKMADMNGITATEAIKEEYPETAVLALTMYEDDQYFFEMLKAGAAGYIPKRAAPDELVSAIRIVNKGDVFLYPSLATRLVQDYLKPREREVLELIAEGLTNAEIAQELVISTKTVDRHRENIMRKLDLHSGIALVKYAIKIGLIELED